MSEVQKSPSAQDTTDLLRRQRREDFLKRCGWTDVVLQGMQADASFRRYYRVQGGKHPALLMEDPPDRPPVPPFVMVEPFILIADHLRNLGFSTPEIFEKDIDNGLLLIEDFGDDTYTRLLKAGVSEEELFEPAVDVLSQLHKNPHRNDLAIGPYDSERYIEEAMLLIDWYYPALTGHAADKDLRESFVQIWQRFFLNLPQDQSALVLRDYHVDNIMRLKDRAGVQSCGLLDFQDALIGQFSYDLMSLLEDARWAMRPELKSHLYNRYLNAMKGHLDEEAFAYSFNLLGAQRHAKVLGIFVRLFARDGKDRYLEFIPHVRSLMMQSLQRPGLEELAQWFVRSGIDFSKPLSVEKSS